MQTACKEHLSPEAAIEEFNKSEKSDEPAMSDLSIYNFDYQYVGENSISPLKVFDDQQFTYFQFARKKSKCTYRPDGDTGG